MRKQIVKVTEAARSFQNLIDRVRDHGQDFEIQLGRDIVARIVPAGPGDLPVAELGRIFSELPRLEPGDVEAFAQDVRRLRQEMRSARSAC